MPFSETPRAVSMPTAAASAGKLVADALLRCLYLAVAQQEEEADADRKNRENGDQPERQGKLAAKGFEHTSPNTPSAPARYRRCKLTPRSERHLPVPLPVL